MQEETESGREDRFERNTVTTWLQESRLTPDSSGLDHRIQGLNQATEPLEAHVGWGQEEAESVRTS